MMRSPYLRAQRTTCLALVGVLALTTLACLGRSPEVRLYTLGAEPRAVDADRPSETAVVIGSVRFPRYLERPQIVRRLAGGALELDEFNRWAGSFEDNVIRALGLAVSERLGSDRVVTSPADPAFAVDFRVAVRFDELVVAADGTLQMRAAWSIATGARGEAPVLGRTDRDLPVDGRSPRALVAAHERLIETLGGDIAAAIEGERP